MMNKRTVDYHPSPSELTWRIHSFIFLWTPKGFISAEYFLNFFSIMYILSWLRKSFKCFKSFSKVSLMMLRLLENTIVRQKIKTNHFYSCPQAKLSPRFLSSLPQAEGNYPMFFIQTKHRFLKIYGFLKILWLWFYTFHYHVLRVQIIENMIYRIDSKNEWLLLSASFTAKFGLVFFLALEKVFS